MTFENRSARTAGHASCAVCTATGAADADDTATDADDGEESRQDTLDRVLEERTVVVGGAALAGAALGALVTFMLVSRR
jgi:hypothetical protein